MAVVPDIADRVAAAILRFQEAHGRAPLVKELEFELGRARGVVLRGIRKLETQGRIKLLYQFARAA